MQNPIEVNSHMAHVVSSHRIASQLSVMLTEPLEFTTDS